MNATTKILTKTAPFNWGAALTAALVSGIAYLVVDTFEEGYNVYYGIPGDFVQANILSVFHVAGLSVIAWEALFYNARTLFLISAIPFAIIALSLLFAISVRVYWQYPLQFVFASFVNFVAAFVFIPTIALLSGIVAFFALNGVLIMLRQKGRATLVVLLGDPDWQLKLLVIAMYIMSPSFFLGYSFAAYETRFAIATMGSQPAQHRFVAVRFQNDLVIMKPFSERVEAIKRNDCDNVEATITDSISFAKLGEDKSLSFDNVTLCETTRLLDIHGTDLDRRSNLVCIRGREHPCG